MTEETSRESPVSGDPCFIPEVHCDVCGSLFSAQSPPRELTCVHTLCTKCISSHTHYDTVQCPVCHVSTPTDAVTPNARLLECAARFASGAAPAIRLPTLPHLCSLYAHCTIHLAENDTAPVLKPLLRLPSGDLVVVVVYPVHPRRREYLSVSVQIQSRASFENTVGASSGWLGAEVLCTDRLEGAHASVVSLAGDLDAQFAMEEGGAAEPPVVRLRGALVNHSREEFTVRINETYGFPQGPREGLFIPVGPRSNIFSLPYGYVQDGVCTLHIEIEVEAGASHALGNFGNGAMPTLEQCRSAAAVEDQAWSCAHVPGIVGADEFATVLGDALTLAVDGDDSLDLATSSGELAERAAKSPTASLVFSSLARVAARHKLMFSSAASSRLISLTDVLVQQAPATLSCFIYWCSFHFDHEPWIFRAVAPLLGEAAAIACLAASKTGATGLMPAIAGLYDPRIDANGSVIAQNVSLPTPPSPLPVAPQVTLASLLESRRQPGVPPPLLDVGDDGALGERREEARSRLAESFATWHGAESPDPLASSGIVVERRQGLPTPPVAGSLSITQRPQSGTAASAEFVAVADRRASLNISIESPDPPRPSLPPMAPNDRAVTKAVTRAIAQERREHRARIAALETDHAAASRAQEQAIIAAMVERDSAKATIEKQLDKITKLNNKITILKQQVRQAIGQRDAYRTAADLAAESTSSATRDVAHIGLQTDPRPTLSLKLDNLDHGALAALVRGSTSFELI